MKKHLCWKIDGECPDVMNLSEKNEALRLRLTQAENALRFVKDWFSSLEGHEVRLNQGGKVLKQVSAALQPEGEKK